jgi:hypothetical protein
VFSYKSGAFLRHLTHRVPGADKRFWTGVKVSRRHPNTYSHENDSLSLAPSGRGGFLSRKLGRVRASPSQERVTVTSR